MRDFQQIFMDGFPVELYKYPWRRKQSEWVRNRKQAKQYFPAAIPLRGRPFDFWGGGWVIYGLQDFFFLATWWVGYFFTAVQEFFSITFDLHAIFFFRQALAGNFFSKSPTPPTRVKWSAPNSLYILCLYPYKRSILTVFLSINLHKNNNQLKMKRK